MSNRVERLTVTLTSEMVHAVKVAVDSGEYASSSEIVREALRDWRRKRLVQEQEFAGLRADVLAGIEDMERGQVRDFDADRVIAKGKRKQSDRSPSV
ncbi:MAG: ribbon-helix-helix protein, CopG family [Rhodospirillales bacterium]|nr:ribbon-helix-helix protein, CopG family [Rhodospirillales bacterium]